jgi:AcrR family transcriptional regulator
MKLRTKTTKDEAGTRERVLDVAEMLFAERGLNAVSIRDITREAEANLGAINYHFGTKEGLIAAVLERRMAPLEAQRLKALDAVEAAAKSGQPKLEAVLEAIFRPAVEQAMDSQRGGATFSKILARLLLEPNPAADKVIRSQFEPMIRRFDAALMRAMPKLTPQDVFWRMHLLIGALHHSLLLLDREPPPGVPKLRTDTETYVKRFVAFAVATFRASLPCS